jgi:hypothetical protein
MPDACRLVDTNPALGDGRGPPDENPVRGDVAEYRVVAASCKLIGCAEQNLNEQKREEG